MAIEIVVPEVGEAGMEVVFVEWLKSEGDFVKVGEPLFELDTSKAVITVEAFADGVLADLRVAEGDSVAHGDVLALLREEGDLDGGSASPAAGAVAPAAAEPTAAASDEDDALRRDRVRTAVAEMTTRSWATVPHFHLTAEVDLTETLLQLKPTVAIARAIAVALQRHPECNLRWTEEGQLERRDGVDLGLLVDTPVGLLLPVVRGADAMDSERLGRSLREAATRASTGTLLPEDQGSRSISLSNLGMFAVDRFAGVIAAPDVLLLTAGRVRRRQREHEGDWKPRSVVDLTLAVDHRALDGAEAARLLETLEGVLGGSRRAAVSEIEIKTAGALEAIDVTAMVAEVTGTGDGVLWLRTPHTTTALTVNEADEPLMRDLERVAAELLAPLQPFEHARKGNPNAAAHLAASIFGRECLLEVEEGELRLGVHQRVVMLELDGPKDRKLVASRLGWEGGADGDDRDRL